jgi:hypothetical protein
MVGLVAPQQLNRIDLGLLVDESMVDWTHQDQVVG